MPRLVLSCLALLLLVAAQCQATASETPVEKSIEEADEEDDDGPSIPCTTVVDGKQKCIELGFKEDACESPVIELADITCPTEHHPSIVLLPSNEQESFMPAKFMLCMSGGKWMLGDGKGGLMEDPGLAAPIHVTCFPPLPEGPEDEVDPFDSLEEEEDTEKEETDELKEVKNGADKEKEEKKKESERENNEESKKEETKKNIQEKEIRSQEGKQDKEEL